MEKKYVLNFYGKNHQIVLRKSSYVSNGTLAVLMVEVMPDGTEEDFATLTVNLGTIGKPKATDKSQFIDSNNLGNDIGKWLIKNGIAVPTPIFYRSGFCVYQLFEFKEQVLDSMKEYSLICSTF